MSKIHWLGAGLSSVPGIRRLAAGDRELILWNRTQSKAKDALAGLNSKATARALEWDHLRAAVSNGDVVVSMLPATMHLPVAEICLAQHSHFVSSSYVSPEMRALDAQAQAMDLCLVNEVGLDPGLDHMLAHALVHEYKSSPQFDPANEHSFRSYCGGFPKVPNDFKYKFSWSPLGVLRALKSPAKWIADGQTQSTEKPWTSVKDYSLRLPTGEETFQSYPNRDSLPFRDEYGFESDWSLREFVRGTLRLGGWSEAWREIFELVENAVGDAGARAMAEKSEALWNRYRYDAGEPDRVVLAVELEAARDGGTVWHQFYCLDAAGDNRGSAMGRLVSLTTSIAVDSVMAGEISAGVSAAPKEIKTVDRWLAEMTRLGESFQRIVVV